MKNLIRQAIVFGLALTWAAAALGQASTPRRLTDEMGRQVLVPETPHRIICLAPSVTETVYALGAGEMVIAVTDYTDFPPEARKKPSIGGLVDATIEKIVSFKPDLVLAEGGINRRETADQLERFGIPVYTVHPQGLQGILGAIGHIGEALNRVAEAQKLIHDLEEKENQVTARVKGLPRPTIFVLIWHEPVITVGNKAFITDVISVAGGKSSTADIPQTWPQISMEEVLRRSPDFLLLVKGSHGSLTAEELKSHEGWKRLEAVQSNHVIYAEEQIQHPSPVVFDALVELAKKLHPDAFASR